MTHRWGRINTSQWHLVHSIRTYPNGDEFILTVDGYDLPTVLRNRREWNYETNRSEPQPDKLTNAKIFEGSRPQGRRCTNCTSFLYHLERSVSLDT